MKRIALACSLTIGLFTVCLAEDQKTDSANTPPQSSGQTSAEGEKVSLESLPKAVQQRIKYQAAYLPLQDIKRVMRGGEQIYEATFAKNKTATILQLREDGSTAGMRIASSAPVIVEPSAAQRRAAQTSTATTTTQTQPAQPQGDPSVPSLEAAGAAAASQQPTTEVQQTPTTGGGITGQLPPTGPTGGGITGQLPPTPGSKGVPGGGLTGQLPIEDNSAQATAQSSTAGTQQNQGAAQLPAQIRTAVQNQIGGMSIESAQQMTIYQINVRNPSGQLETIWVDDAGRVLQSANR